MRNQAAWARLDTIIKNELQSYNIDIDFDFDIVEKGTAIPTTMSRHMFIHDDLYEALKESGYELRIRFPQKSDFIKAQMGYVFISSIALLMLVSVSFLLIYKYYKREKKLTTNIIDFVNNITHELKTPLTNIALANSMISKSTAIQKDEKLWMYSNVIKDEHKRLKDKVDVLLKTTLLENEKPINVEIFDADVEVKFVANTFLVQLTERGGSISIGKTGENFNVKGNIDMFHIAIGNLIDNAIRYSTSSPEISILLSSQNGILKIAVTDNGIGIPKGELPNIFDKYYRVTNGDVHNSDGIGLGLYIVKSIVLRMEGQITVSSELGKGTEFTIKLPLA
jgi:two-component system phosphate regulon sensor histidine kinase PhoR